MSYEHTQRGKLLVVTAAIVVAVVSLVGALLPRTGDVLPSSVAGAVVIAVVALFNRLTVAVGGGELRAAFGFGWPSRTMAIADIVDVRIVRNRWYHGWGIRKIARGWMFNVWGLDAVELRMTSGRSFRIGTDQPAELEAAIAAERSR
ncbi:MAG: hypothetical protein AAGA93_11915 [Actinomycetota bacterium]